MTSRNKVIRPGGLPFNHSSTEDAAHIQADINKSLDVKYEQYVQSASLNSGGGGCWILLLCTSRYLCSMAYILSLREGKREFGEGMSAS